MKIYPLLSWTFIGAVLFCTHSYAAQGINAQTLNPSTSDHYVLTEDALTWPWPVQHRYYLGANYNYVKDPLVGVNPLQNSREFNIIKSIQTLDLMGGGRISDRVGLFASLPVHYVRFEQNPSFGFPSGEKSALGDLKVLGKVRLTENDSDFAFALIPEVQLPTGSVANYVSNGSLYLAMHAAAELKLNSKLQVAGNIGYGYASDAILNGTSGLTGIDYRNRIVSSIGALWRLNQTWGANVEYASTVMMPFDQGQNPNDFYLGGRYEASDHLVFTLGGSLGKVGGPTGQTYRAVAGVRFVPFANDDPEEPQVTPKQVVQNMVRYTEEKIEILLPVNFKNASAELLPESKKILDEVAEVVLANIKKIKKMYVDGHTNHIGNDQYNMKLSKRRSASVRDYLVTKGVPEKIMVPRGFGETMPLVPESDPEAIPRNRRTEFNIEQP